MRIQKERNSRPSPRDAGPGYARERFSEVIAAIIPTYAGETRIAETLDSLARLVIPAGYSLELCIVDNFGRDETAGVVDLWSRRHSSLPVRYIRQPVPGKMNALQLGIDSCSAEWIIMIDDDVSIDREWLVAAFSAIQKYSNVGFCGGPISLGGTGEVPHWINPVLSYFAIYDFGSEIFKLTNRQLAGAGLLMRREAWQQSVPAICRLTGRTNGSLVAGEDIESQRSIQHQGWIGLYVPEMRLIHRIDRSRFKRSIVARQTFSVGLEKCFHRMAGRPSLAAIFVLPASILYDWPRALVRLATTCREETWIFERNLIFGQMLSPFYYVWHRLKSGLRRIGSPIK